MTTVSHLPVEKTKLQKLPQDEHVLLLLLGYSANQIIMLQKLVWFSTSCFFVRRGRHRNSASILLQPYLFSLWERSPSAPSSATPFLQSSAANWLW